MKWGGIALGQVLSLLYLGTGVFSEYLVNLGINTPVFQNVWMYFFLALIYSLRNVYLRVQFQGKIAWKQHWKYLLASLTDSQCNFLVILSYQYTSLTSVFILGNSSVLMVCVLSYVFLNRRYNKYQISGVAISLIGILAAIFASLIAEDWKFEGSVVGNCLVLLG